MNDFNWQCSRTNEKVREGSILRRKSVQSLFSGPFGHPHAVKYRDGCDKHAVYSFYARLQPRMYESFGLESERLQYLAVRNNYDFNTVKKPIEIGVLHSCQLIFPSWLFPSWQAVLPTLQLLQYVDDCAFWHLYSSHPKGTQKEGNELLPNFPVHSLPLLHSLCTYQVRTRKWGRARAHPFPLARFQT